MLNYVVFYIDLITFHTAYQLMMTTSIATPPAPPKRPRRTRRRKAKVVMTNQTQTTTETPKRVKPDVELLSNEVIIKDIKNRWLLIKYEAAELSDDLIKLFNWSKTSVNKLIDRIKSVEL